MNFAFLTFTEVKLVKLLLSLYNYSREERWLSGRRRPPGERVDRRRTCLVGSNPTLSAKFASNRAKRGDSGALYLQSATAGLNSSKRFFLFDSGWRNGTMKVGSCATNLC